MKMGKGGIIVVESTPLQWSFVILLFNSYSCSFTSNLCGLPNSVFIRIRLTRRGSSPLTRTFTSERVSLGENYVCVDGELSKNLSL